MPAMSILCAAPAVDPFDWIHGLLVGFLVLSLGLMALYRVHVLRRIAGPPRLQGEQNAEGILLIMLIAAFTAYFAAPMLYSTLCRQLGHLPQSSGPVDLTPNQKTGLQILCPCVGFLILLLGDALCGAGIIRSLGFNPRRLPGGLLSGILGLIIIYPVILLVMFFVQFLIPPGRHSLFQTMTEVPSPLAKITLEFTAVVAIPFFEEYLFRGHMQTLLRRSFTILWRRLFRSSAAQPLWPVWLAVLITSLLFSLAHPTWEMPGIFLLALAMGYVYERTGNLWSCISMHVLFNAIGTVHFVCHPS